MRVPSSVNMAAPSTRQQQAAAAKDDANSGTTVAFGAAGTHATGAVTAHATAGGVSESGGVAFDQGGTLKA